MNVAVAVGGNGFNERCRFGSGDFVFASGIDLGDDNEVRVVEGRDEVVPQIPGTRIAVRLESDDNPAAGIRSSTLLH